MYEELIGKLRGCEGYSCDDCELRKEELCNPILMEKAADAIEELSKPKWISVEERLPKVRQKVLFSYRGCITKQPRIFIGWYNGKQWDSLFATEYDVTHWMPLPEPPKEETDG